MDFTYLKFLRTLLGFKDKLPIIMAQIQIIVAAVKVIMETASPNEPSAPAPGELAITEDVELSGEELEAEAEIASLIAGPTGAFDGSLLRKVFALAKSNPELWAFLTKLLFSKLGL